MSSSTKPFPQSMSDAEAAAKQAADRATDIGRDAVDQLDSSRGSIADGLNKTASAIRSSAPGPIAEHAETAAGAIEDAAEYVRNRDVFAMASDLTAVVKRNPGPSLIAAVAVGFLIGMMFRRD